MGEQATHDACAQQGDVGAEHKRFEAFVGKFKAVVKLWMGPGDPMESTGEMINTLELGGRFLKQDFHGDQTDGPFPNFEGRGYWGYNSVDKRYEGFWIDTASTALQTEEGSVDQAGTTWTMTGEMTDPQSGGKMKKRSIIKLIDNDHHSMEMFFGTPDGNEFKGMEIQYERVK